MTNKIQFLLRIFFVSLFFTELAGCSIPAKPNSLDIQRLIVVNESSSSLVDVRIYVGETHEFVNCGYILANSECSIGFPLREYQGNRFEVSWIDNGRAKSVKDIQASMADNLSPGEPVNAVITIGRQGLFSARLQH